MSYNVANCQVGTQVTATGLNVTCTCGATGRMGSIQLQLSLAEVSAAPVYLSFVVERADRLRGRR